MLTLRKLLRSCFAYATLIYLLASCSVLPALLRMRASNRDFLQDASRTPTLLENLLLLLAQFIFVLPVLLTATNGMAWWALRTSKKSARMWALAASLSLLLTGIGLGSLDLYLNSRFPTGHPPLFAWIIGGHLLVGIAGLIAFSSRDSSLADAQPPRIAGDGTHKYLDTIGIILQVGATIWLMNLYSRWGKEQGLPFAHGLDSWIQWFFVIGVVVLLHESAHALVGIAVGMKLRAFIVGPFQFRLFEGRWKFELHPSQLLAFSGAAGLVPLNPDESRWSEVAMIVAGPFVNLLTGTVAAALAYSAPGASWWSLWEFFALFATVSLVTGIVNLIPLRPDGLYSDGARILQLFRHSPVADFHRAAKTVTSTLVSARRAKDFDIAAIERAAPHYNAGEQALLLRLWAMEYYKQTNALAKADAALAEAERIYSESASNIPASLHTPFVINCALLRRDASGTRQWWQRMQTRKIERRNGDYWLAKCCFHWAEGDLEAAHAAWTTGHALLASLPDAGAYNNDRDCYAQMKEILENPAVPHSAKSLEFLSRHLSMLTTLPAAAE